VICEMNSEEWECGDDCLAFICVFIIQTYIMAFCVYSIVMFVFRRARTDT
jgi:hypothetical protein